MLENEKIGRTLAGQPHHVPVVILNPSVDDLPIHQLDRDEFLLLTDRFEKSSLFKRIFGRRCAAALGVGIALGTAKRHAGIVTKRVAEGATRGEKQHTTRYNA